MSAVHANVEGIAAGAKQAGLNDIAYTADKFIAAARGPGKGEPDPILLELIGQVLSPTISKR